MTPDGTPPDEPSAGGATDRPVLRIVRGNPTAEELAALVAVVTAATAGSAEAPPAARGQWRARGRNIRPALSHGPDAWRASGFPR